MQIFRKERYPNGRRHIYFCGIKIFSYSKKRKLSKYDEIYARRFDGLSPEEIRYCLEQQFMRSVGYPLNLDNPKTFNEKLQWLKFYYRNPLMTKCADKVAVREYIKQKIGEKYLIPCIGVWDNPDDIDFDKLPDKFVLKVNWGSGQNIIVKDKSKLNIRETRRQLAKWMRPESNHYFMSFEWCYKDIKPKIIAEKYIEQMDGNLLDYKIFCNNGEPNFLFVAIDRGKDLRFNFYDLDFQKLPFKQHYENSNNIIKKPKQFDEMLNIARILAEKFVHCRVDFYIVGDALYFGEITFYHFNGMEKFEPQEWDRKLGDLLILPKE